MQFTLNESNKTKQMAREQGQRTLKWFGSTKKTTQKPLLIGLIRFFFQIGVLIYRKSNPT